MRPAFILGIDGLPYTLARRLIDDGTMPNLGRLARQGTLSRMHTTVPDFSCVAWTSFATGVNPGKHGIYGFQDFHFKTGEAFTPTVADCQAPALWHEVGRAGGRSMVLNLPGTYPALPLRGKMVSGFVAPEFDKACYPATFAQTLKTLGYRMDLDGQMGLGGPQYTEQAIGPVFEARKTAIRHLIRNEYWDLCIAVITETDRLQHFFLHTLSDPGHPQHQWTRSFYVELDAFIGELAELLDGKADLFMVSDHGFEVVRQLVLVEDLLRGLGLAPASDVPCWSDPAVAARTHVFCLDPGRFYINRKGGRFPGAFVGEQEAQEILERLTQALWNLKDPETGAPMVSSVRTKQEGFWGDTTAYAPDLVAATNPGYYFRAFWFPEKTNTVNIKWEANHVWNDAIVFTPYSIPAGYQPMIWDVLPSALAQMGVALPAGIDGRDLKNVPARARREYSVPA
jgi:predicted AlkP superfamily phosphohydrolase/phosphomutase